MLIRKDITVQQAAAEISFHYILHTSYTTGVSLFGLHST